MVRMYCRTHVGTTPKGGNPLRTNDVYREIRYYPPRRSSCTKKVRYLSEADAIAAASQHEWEFVCTGMNVYRCWKHQCWHIGHRDKNGPVRLKFREDFLWLLALARLN